jgi:hypothetical protein
MISKIDNYRRGVFAYASGRVAVSSGSGRLIQLGWAGSRERRLFATAGESRQLGSSVPDPDGGSMGVV